MKILVDTHCLLWILNNPERLSQAKRHVLGLDTTEVYASSVNFWEISLKSAIGKIKLKKYSVDEIVQNVNESNIQMINLTPEEAISYHKLPITEHKDPFDRMLIWQAIQNDYHFMTEDTLIKKYSEKYRVKIV